MQTKKPALGRGLEAILVENENEGGGSGRVLQLRISQIEPNSAQPRKNFDMAALEAMSASIREYGILQPITVRELPDGNYGIIAGERRWRAARLAGLTEIPAIISDAGESRAAELALVENLQRADLDPIEEARGFESLIEDWSMTQDELARRMGRSRSSITNSLRLLDLPEEVIALVSGGELATGHAKVLLGLRDAELCINAAKEVVRLSLSVRETEKLVKRLNAPVKEEPVKVIPAVDYAKNLENTVRELLGRPVRLVGGTDGAGKISIEYTDNEDLEKLLVRLCGEEILKKL